MIFTFETDEESYLFCEEIAKTMVALFDISLAEAIGRVNRQWKGNNFLGPTDSRYHEDEAFWAKDIYYGANSCWWKNPSNLKPLPFEE